MKIKAIKSFIGVCSMNVGEIKDIESNEVVKDLVGSGLAIEVEAEKPVVKKEKEEKPKTQKKTTAKKPATKRAAKKTTNK